MERWREELYQNSLMHYGVKGMRKGVRRFQNADGSLTAAGERRYLDPRTASQLRERIANPQQTSSRPVQGTNRVVTSTRQRESLEGGDRNRRVAIVNRRGHIQRVQDVVEEKKQEERTEAAEDSKPVVKEQSRSESSKPSSPQTKSPQYKKEVARIASGQAQGAVAGAKPFVDKREAERQRLLERAEREREANRKGLTANPQPKTKKKKTVDDFKKKGERYVAKKTR